MLSDVLLLILVTISIHLFLKSIDKEIERGQRLSSFLAVCLLLPSIIAFYNNYSFLDLALFLVLLFFSFSLSLLILLLKLLVARINVSRASQRIAQYLTSVLYSEDYWEFFRKSFHGVVLLLLIPPYLLWSFYLSYSIVIKVLVGTDLPIDYHNFLKYLVIIFSGALAIYFYMLETARVHFGIRIFPKKLLRTREERTFATYFYTALSIFFVAIFFPQDVIIKGIISSLIYDSSAAIFGKSFGKHKILEDRTLEGFLAGSLSAIIVLAYLSTDFLLIFLVITALTLADLANSKVGIDDNLLFPVLTTTILYIGGGG
ncbi:MAG: hypothetical protein ACTSVA_01435 [Candidatus Njordarchaeales archaeon]